MRLGFLTCIKFGCRKLKGHFKNLMEKKHLKYLSNCAMMINIDLVCIYFETFKTRMSCYQMVYCTGYYGDIWHTNPLLSILSIFAVFVSQLIPIPIKCFTRTFPNHWVRYCWNLKGIQCMKTFANKINLLRKIYTLVSSYLPILIIHFHFNPHI